MKIKVILLTSLLGVPSVACTSVIGKATVIDGDTIEIHGQRIRLYGIDAPEHDQTCTKGNDAWRCGQEAALTLADRIGEQTVVCDDHGHDRYDRLLSVCSVKRGGDLNAFMVRTGLALAYRRYSQAYVPEEQEAQAHDAGMWAGQFIPPWKWRHRNR